MIWHITAKCSKKVMAEGQAAARVQGSERFSHSDTEGNVSSGHVTWSELIFPFNMDAIRILAAAPRTYSCIS